MNLSVHWDDGSECTLGNESGYCSVLPSIEIMIMRKESEHAHKQSMQKEVLLYFAC